MPHEYSELGYRFAQNIFFKSSKFNLDMFELQNNDDYIFEDRNIEITIHSEDIETIFFHLKLDHCEFEERSVYDTRYMAHPKPFEFGIILDNENLRHELEVSFNQCFKNPNFDLYRERIGYVLQVHVE